MFRWTVLSSVLAISISTLSAAQAPVRPTDPVFVRAQTLVSDGSGAAGRALIDSVIKATPSGAPLYPQALFWRATLASNAADAESDYKHIVVDYPLAPQAADALLRLAQLELARGDREGALGHLQRVPRDYPRSKLLARASYWTARVLFEKNDVARACVANASALAEADTTEIELRNQIQYQRQRCPSMIAATAAAAPTPTPAATATSDNNQGASVAAAATTSVTASTTPTRTTATTPTSAPALTSVRTPTESVAPVAANPATPVEKERSDRYSVQVAAYSQKPAAEQLVSTLKKSGYEARVDGSVAPFRVRIGRYATWKEAEDALRLIKAKRMEGFVAQVSER